jgi:hypothetical protein
LSGLRAIYWSSLDLGVLIVQGVKIRGVEKKKTRLPIIAGSRSAELIRMSVSVAAVTITDGLTQGIYCKVESVKIHRIGTPSYILLE